MPKIASALVVALLAAAPQTLTPDNQPADPFKIADNLYYVGSSDIASYLITTLDGHLLIDGGYPETAALIRANVGKLGFEMRDIKILLNTQAHFDHAGGFAELKRLTGARMMASEQDAHTSPAFADVPVSVPLFVSGQTLAIKRQRCHLV